MAIDQSALLDPLTALKDTDVSDRIRVATDLDATYCKARGLGGVTLVISDAHEGLKTAIAPVLLGSSWQRCQVQNTGNVRDAVSKTNAEMVAAAIRTIFAQPDAAHVAEQFEVITTMRTRSHPKVARMLTDAREDLLAFTRTHPSRSTSLLRHTRPHTRFTTRLDEPSTPAWTRHARPSTPAPQPHGLAVAARVRCCDACNLGRISVTEATRGQHATRRGGACWTRRAR